MNILKTVYDKDVFPNPEIYPDVIDWVDRLTVKVVLFNDDNNIALIGNNVNDYFLLPGGGVDKEEDLAQSAIRECKEETGCIIEIVNDLGTTEDYRQRNSRHCVTFGYIGKVVSFGESDLTENEKDIGAYTKWVSLSEAKLIFDKQAESLKHKNIGFYNTGFNIIRDRFFINRVIDLKNDIKK